MLDGLSSSERRPPKATCTSIAELEMLLNGSGTSNQLGFSPLALFGAARPTSLLY